MNFYKYLMPIPISYLDNPIPIAVSNEFCKENLFI
jgi:hypothetical protein